MQQNSMVTKGQILKRDRQRFPSSAMTAVRLSARARFLSVFISFERLPIKLSSRFIALNISACKILACQAFILFRHTDDNLYIILQGNSYVKNKQWDKAIEFYTKAINCYSYDPVFYANRALCYLIKEK